MTSETKPGCLIVFEGIDGCGKSTQLRRLAERMRAAGLPLHETKEPTDRPIGRLLRQFLEGKERTDARAMAMLFAADRLDHLVNEADGLVAKVQGGGHILSDRYYLSSYAYQSAQMPLPWVMDINAQSAALLRPACHIFIDVSPETAMARLKQSRPYMELYESLEQLREIRKNFFAVFECVKDTENVVIINGERSEADIASDVWAAVQALLGANGEA